MDQLADLNDITATGSGELGAVVLLGAHIGGTLHLNPKTVTDGSMVTNKSHSEALCSLDGLVYSGFPNPANINDWLSLFRDGTPTYAAQPYRQLAAATAAAGHDRDTRRILMAQREDQVKRKAVDRRQRMWIRFTGRTLGYGYEPLRALLGLLAVILIALILTLATPGSSALTDTEAILSTTGSMATSQPDTNKGTSRPSQAQCSLTERIDVALSYSVPSPIWPRSDAACIANSTTGGKILTWTRYPLIIASWSLASLFLAGFTNAVRKN